MVVEALVDGRQRRRSNVAGALFAEALAVDGGRRRVEDEAASRQVRRGVERRTGGRGPAAAGRGGLGGGLASPAAGRQVQRVPGVGRRRRARLRRRRGVSARLSRRPRRPVPPVRSFAVARLSRGFRRRRRRDGTISSGGRLADDRDGNRYRQRERQRDRDRVRHEQRGRRRRHQSGGGRRQPPPGGPSEPQRRRRHRRGLQGEPGRSELGGGRHRESGRRVRPQRRGEETAGARQRRRDRGRRRRGHPRQTEAHARGQSVRSTGARHRVHRDATLGLDRSTAAGLLGARSPRRCPSRISAADGRVSSRLSSRSGLQQQRPAEVNRALKVSSDSVTN